MNTIPHKTVVQSDLVSSTPFTGKERDRETGFSYFGARYYDSDLSGLFLSVDPMADKYLSISPYAYCAWSPVKLVDPTGMDTIVSIDLNTGYSSINVSDESFGKQMVEFLYEDKIIETYKCLGTLTVSRNNEINTIVDFSTIHDANSVYDFLMGKNNCNMDSDVEWNCYDKKDGSGKLVTSHLTDEIKVSNIDVNKYNASKWRHYHPGNRGLSLLPSEQDMNYSKSLGVPSYLSFCGKEYRFDLIVNKYGTKIPEGKLRDLISKNNNGFLLFCK